MACSKEAAPSFTHVSSWFPRFSFFACGDCSAWEIEPIVAKVIAPWSELVDDLIGELGCSMTSASSCLGTLLGFRRLVAASEDDILASVIAPWSELVEDCADWLDCHHLGLCHWELRAVESQWGLAAIVAASMTFPVGGIFLAGSAFSPKAFGIGASVLLLGTGMVMYCKRSSTSRFGTMSNFSFSLLAFGIAGAADLCIVEADFLLRLVQMQYSGFPFQVPELLASFMHNSIALHCFADFLVYPLILRNIAVLGGLTTIQLVPAILLNIASNGLKIAAATCLTQSSVLICSGCAVAGLAVSGILVYHSTQKDLSLENKQLVVFFLDNMAFWWSLPGLVQCLGALKLLPAASTMPLLFALDIPCKLFLAHSTAKPARALAAAQRSQRTRTHASSVRSHD